MLTSKDLLTLSTWPLCDQESDGPGFIWLRYRADSNAERNGLDWTTTEVLMLWLVRINAGPRVER